VRYKLVDERPKTFVLVFETGDELSQGLKKFAHEQRLASASFKAIGSMAPGPRVAIILSAMGSTSPPPRESQRGQASLR
jgi:hypothetical protein